MRYPLVNVAFQKAAQPYSHYHATPQEYDEIIAQLLSGRKVWTPAEGEYAAKKREKEYYRTIGAWDKYNLWGSLGLGLAISAGLPLLRYALNKLGIRALGGAKDLKELPKSILLHTLVGGPAGLLSYYALKGLSRLLVPYPKEELAYLSTIPENTLLIGPDPGYKHLPRSTAVP